MADYVKVNFTNEVPATTPVKYKISQTTDGDICTDATIELVTAVTPGTPLDATNLDHVEDGIYNAQHAADLAQADATQALADADTAQTAANAAQATADAAVPKSTVLAAGDLIVATGSAAVSRLAKGSNRQVLGVNSSGSLAYSFGMGAIATYPNTTITASGVIVSAGYSSLLYTNGGFSNASDILIPVAGPYLINVYGVFDADGVEINYLELGYYTVIGGVGNQRMTFIHPGAISTARSIPFSASFMTYLSGPGTIRPRAVAATNRTLYDIEMSVFLMR